MLKKHKKTLIAASIVTLLPVIAGICLWNRLPDPMATHFGTDNTPNGYSSKAFAVFGLPLILLLAEWAVAVVTASDPKKQNISPRLFGLILWVIPVISVFDGAVEYAYHLGYPVNFSRVVPLLLGVVFLIVGNLLPKARQNYTLGIKLPWTLANEENWNRTHRLAGFLWAAGGLVIIIGTLTGLLQGMWVIAVFAVMAAVPTAYSYYLHVKCGL